jgi:hypothetical protein
LNKFDVGGARHMKCSAPVIVEDRRRTRLVTARVLNAFLEIRKGPAQMVELHRESMLVTVSVKGGREGMKPSPSVYW